MVSLVGISKTSCSCLAHDEAHRTAEALRTATVELLQVTGKSGLQLGGMGFSRLCAVLGKYPSCGCRGFGVFALPAYYFKTYFFALLACYIH